MTRCMTATFRVVTPLFCGGATGDAELRLPSIKGCLRFWWRALAWSRCDGNLDRIREEEDFIFGSAKGGQSRLHLRLETPRHRPEPVNPPQVLQDPYRKGAVVGMGARYLGYGVLEAFGSKKKDIPDGRLIRSCMEPKPSMPIEFTVFVRFRKDLEREHLTSVANTFKTMGLLGGIGAKNRKGYGSLVLTELHLDGETVFTPPRTCTALTQSIGALIPKEKSQKEVPYTAFTGDTRLLLLTPNGSASPLKMLDLVGRELVRYRSWGNKGKILKDEDSERNFRSDHDLMKDPAAKRDRHPDRIAFGLPHNYGKIRDQQVGPAAKHLDRRASPLFVHIHMVQEKPVAVLSFFPTLFLPQDARSISVGEAVIPQKEAAQLYQPVHAFLDRLMDPQQRKEHFGTVMAVKP